MRAARTTASLRAPRGRNPESRSRTTASRHRAREAYTRRMADPAASPSLPFAQRAAPALTLVFLAPVVAEFLLADFTVRDLGILIVLVPLYGCGALLIREGARRAHRGWPTIVLLALAYALLEEAFLTQSLFNPNYVGQRLLDYGFIPPLRTSLNWARSAEQPAS